MQIQAKGAIEVQSLLNPFDLYKQLEANNDCEEIKIFSSNPLEGAWEAFNRLFQKIHAGGGLVTASTGEILLIHRNGYWDLPKGKAEKGEDWPTCALREVEEETGLTQLNLGKPLPSTYHLYITKKENHILKETHWFEMQVDGAPTATPQIEEGIDKAEWVMPGKIASLLPEAHASIALLLHGYLQGLPAANKP